MAHIQILSNELLKDILDYIESPQKPVAIDRRNHLSVESFRHPSPPPPSQAQDIGSFRLSCRRFAELGIPYQYTRVSLRFSNAGFRRLDSICSHGRLTKHTRKFSYLVPPFYTCNDPRITAIGERSDLSRQLERKITEQRSILRSGEDVRILKKAMLSFTSLQHVQLLRLVEPVHFGIPNSSYSLEWPPACSHATRTMGEALLYGRSPFCRFSGPMMEPHTARVVPERLSSLLVSRLTCLELHFDGGPELLDRMLQMSTLAKTVFQAAKRLQAIHMGFPSRDPLDLRLESMFHYISWENLRAFGVQAWRLDAQEIVTLVRRHRSTLRGLRLRDVQLKHGSMWRDVLQTLRSEVQQLEWVSLRRIDYSDHFDLLWDNTMEVPDETSDSSNDDIEDQDQYQHQVEDPPPDMSNTGSSAGSDDEDTDEESTADTDHGPEADEISISPDTPSTLPFCTCDKGGDSNDPDELGDNGVAVTYHQRKLWEKWVVGRCPEHT